MRTQSWQPRCGQHCLKSLGRSRRSSNVCAWEAVSFISAPAPQEDWAYSMHRNVRLPLAYHRIWCRQLSPADTKPVTGPLKLLKTMLPRERVIWMLVASQIKTCSSASPRLEERLTQWGQSSRREN